MKVPVNQFQKRRYIFKIKERSRNYIKSESFVNSLGCACTIIKSSGHKCLISCWIHTPLYNPAYISRYSVQLLFERKGFGQEQNYNFLKIVSNIRSQTFRYELSNGYSSDLACSRQVRSGSCGVWDTQVVAQMRIISSCPDAVFFEVKSKHLEPIRNKLTIF